MPKTLADVDLIRATPVTDVFAPAALQTVFALSQTPIAAWPFRLRVNGLEARRTAHYTQVGTVLTWLDANYTLAVGDELVAEYWKLP